MRKQPYIAAMIMLVLLYLIGQYYIGSDTYISVVTTVLTIVAGVSFWMEFRSNERINEAQLIMELNDQFITNEQLSNVEWALEKYYARYIEVKRTGGDLSAIPLELDLDINSPHRQHLVNYLVHLEGIAALVNEGVLHLDVISDLMAYRYFVAVNNPLVQERELFPYRNYYKGCFRLYDKWSRKMGEAAVPMAEFGLCGHLNSK